MKFIPITLLFFSIIFSVKGQNLEQDYIKRNFYRDSVVSREKHFGNDNKIDSLITYYNTGEVDEIFHYNENRFHGKSFKLNRKGEKITVWTFENGKLLLRDDIMADYNAKDEQKTKKLLALLKVVQLKIKEKPGHIGHQFNQANIRQRLGNYTLALNGFSKIQTRIFRIKEAKKVKIPNKILGNLYDAKGSIYAHYEMDDLSLDYKLKATKISPENNRLIFNLGAYLYTVKSYRLAKVYLEKALLKWPNHGFTHRVLAAYYTDFEDYEKAKYHIDIAFLKEKNLLKYGSGKLERDIRTLRGFIDHKLGKSESGIKDLKEAIRVNKNNSFAYRNLGEVYLDLESYDLACENLKISQKLNYEKNHDRFDLEAFLIEACDNTEKEIPKTPKFTEAPFIYPNPTRNFVKVKNIEATNFPYYVYDTAGKTLQNGVSTEKTINISNLPANIYILKILLDGSIKSFRIIKE